MGMTIEEARTALGKERRYALHENKQAFDIAIDTMRKFQMMELDYKARLRADMVAVLMAIRGELTKYYKNPYAEFRYDTVQLSEVLRLIDREINTLRGD